MGITRGASTNKLPDFWLWIASPFLPANQRSGFLFWTANPFQPAALLWNSTRDGNRGVGHTGSLRSPERAVARLRLHAGDVVRDWHRGPAVLAGAVRDHLPRLYRLHFGIRRAVPADGALQLGSLRAGVDVVRGHVARDAVLQLLLLLGHGGPAPAGEPGTTAPVRAGANGAANPAASATGSAAATAIEVADAASAAVDADATRGLPLPRAVSRATACSSGLNGRRRDASPAWLNRPSASRGKT